MDLILVGPVHKHVIDFAVAAADRSIGIVEDVAFLLLFPKSDGEIFIHVYEL